jgi:hypothetical protein
VQGYSGGWQDAAGAAQDSHSSAAQRAPPCRTQVRGGGGGGIEATSPIATRVCVGVGVFGLGEGVDGERGEWARRR